MNECKDCEKAYDCFVNSVDVCKRIVQWEELTPDDKLQTEYNAKGVHLNWTRVDGSRPANPNPLGRNGK